MRHLLYAVLALLLAGSGVLIAQTSEYSFTATAGTYTPITGGTLLGTETNDDQRFVDPATPAGGTVTTGPGFPIGFNFTFNGAVFDRLAVNANGWISLGQSSLTPSVNNSSSSAYTPLSSTTAITPEILYNRISALGRDLQAQVGATLRLETIGTAPNRICVIQWTNYKKYGTNGTGDMLNFQIQLHETTNNVKIVYGAFTANATAGNMQVGLRGPLATDFNARQGTGSWMETTAATANTQYVVMTDVNYPANGLTFNFNFPVANQPPNPANLVSPANGATLVSPYATLNWLSGGGLPSGYRISVGTNNPPTNLINNQDLGMLTTFDPPGEFPLSTVIYWQVVPYNGFGNATNCPVWSFTTHGDATITTLPYSQNWDAVTPPALPFDWSFIYQATVTTGYVKTVTTSPQSAPNCIAMYNPTDLNTIAMLIGPQLSTTIPANTIRVKFWGKGSTSYAVKVGVMTNPTDAATFTEIQQITLTASWAQYSVPLTPYTGNGRFIAFKHACLAAGQTIYVDGVDFELITANDLAALSVSGNSTPSVNTATTHTVIVFNNGTASQSTYTVKLFNAANNTELGTSPGLTVAPGAQVGVPITWTPTVEGPMSIYGKVILAGDVNAANDQSPNLNISVMPAGATVVTIGDGNLAEGVPWEFFYKNSLFETLYYPNELTVMGNITAVTFYNNFVSNLTAMPVKLWLGTTQLADLSVGWILPSDGLTLVYDGTLDFPSGINTIVVPLQIPYLYTGGNLVLYANRPMDTQYYNTNDNFAAQTIGTTRARKLYSDSVTYDPAAPSAAGTLSGTFPKTSFTFVVTNMGSLSGTVTSGGNPVEGVAIQVVDQPYNQTTSPTGQYNFPFLPVGTYNIRASKIGYQTLTLPATITASNNTILNFSLIPSSTVSVSGHVVGSDLPTVGLAGVQVHLDGPIDYDGTTNANGDFTITGVLSGNSYNYTLSKVGYSDLTGTAVVGATNLNMGTLTMIEVTNPPRVVVATENTAQTQVALTWRPPGSTGGGGVEDFETDNGGWVPSSNWSNPLGDWEWTNEYTTTGYTDIDTYVDVPPTAAHSGTGLWGTKVLAGYSNCSGWSYLRKTYDLSGITNPVLSFWHYMNGYNTWDYGLILVNGTTVWGSSALAEFMPWQELTVDLAAYGGMSNVVISFEWYATSVVSYAGWYIDDLYVGPAQTAVSAVPAAVSPSTFRGLDEESAALQKDAAARKQPKLSYFTPDSNSNDQRTLNGYKVWRLLQGNETNETTWTQLTANAITDTNYVDTAWGSQPDGNYKWAVKGVYTNGVLSAPAFSNMIRILRNDLSALSVTGNTTPTSGVAANYTVTIKNTGTQAKAAGSYTVKLMNGTTELASVPGPAIMPNDTIPVVVAWTPTIQGPVPLTGKVFLPGDTVPGNDSTPVLNITVMPPGVNVVTIGDGSQTARMPIDMFYKTSMYQTLYYPDEIGTIGMINLVTLYNQFTTTTLVDKPTKIWIGTTQLNDLSAGWIPANDLALVFDGTMTYPAGANDITFPLSNPYPYTGGNLVIMWHRPMDTVYFSSTDYFKCQTVGTNRARNIYNDSTVYDPNNMTGGTLTGQFPKTTLTMTPITGDPLFFVTPNSKNFGTVLINSVNNQSFTVRNAGGGTLTINSITISGSNMFTLQNLPTLPANLSTGQSINFVGRYNPTVEGMHTATITVTDNLARTYILQIDSSNRTPHSIALSGNCIDTTLNTLPYQQAFDAVTAPDLPPDWSYIYQATVTTGYVKTVTTTPHSAPNCVALYNPTDANTIAMLIAPPLGTAIPTNTTRVKFWGRSSGAGYLLSVGVMVNNTDPTTYTETEMITLTTTWTEYVVAFNGYTGTGKHIVFKHGLGGTARTLYVDDVMIEVTPANDLAALALTGNMTPTVGQASQYNISVKNWGTASQSTYTVKMFSSTGVELASAPGVVCAPGATVSCPINWTPPTEGAMTIYGKVILTGDQNNLNDQTPNVTILVNPSGVFSLTVGDGGQFARMPVDMFYKNSLYQGLYYPSEMGNFIGQINALQFYNNFVTDLQNKPTKVWIGTTTQTSLTAAWIPSTQLTLVFDGNINYPSGDNLITIPFNTPYLYLNGENLVIMVNRPMDTQYFNSSDDFVAQTDAVNTSRSRRIWSDSTTYDPAAPPETGATISGQFPKTTFIVIPGGVGHLQGTVLAQGGTPLEGVAVQIPNTTYSTVTNAQGQYQIMNILPNTYSVSFSKYGYITQSINFTLLEDETEIINVTLQPMPVVGVTGVVLASDTGSGISGAIINLTGYQNYNATTTATGAFSFPGVYANQSYAYTINAPGYTTASGNINVGASAYSMGNVTLSEIAYAPFGVQATVNDNFNAINLVWQAPDPTAVEVTEGFEGATFPPTNWTQVITNTGAQVIPGVLPTWCRFGAISAGGTPVSPPSGQYQAGLWWDYNHQDEWLITPNFNCPPMAHLNLAAYIYRGSVYDDHYYIKVSTNNGSDWTVLYDATAQTGGWNYYAFPLTVDLEVYGGQQIKLAFHADDPPSDDGLWYAWFIDNFYVGNATQSVRFSGSELISSKTGTLRSSEPTELIPEAPSPSRAALDGFRNSITLQAAPPTPLRQSRSLQGYKVWRLQAGAENTPAAWTALTPDIISVLNYTDSGWNTIPNGSYRWAVRAIYTNSVTSVPSFSNVLVKETQMGNIVGFVRKSNNQPISGATVTANGVNATTNTAGAYSLPLQVGTYSVTASAPNYLPRTFDGIIVSPNQNTTLNFVLAGVDNEDELIPVNATALSGNYPNPFNPETVISYALKDACQVSLEVYNLKGQMVRKLVGEDQQSGRYRVVFNGKDDSGKALSSGIYLYRLRAGNYTATRKMMLME